MDESLQSFKAILAFCDREMTSSNSNAMPDNLRRHNFVNTDDVLSIDVINDKWRKCLETFSIISKILYECAWKVTNPYKVPNLLDVAMISE